MVLYKRKPVKYVPRPALYEDQEIWVIDETDEIFTNYDDYLARLDYYNQKRFICEVTGLSGLDFFSALQNEAEASNEVDDAFPDPLREPILRKVQHSTISRIDALVDYVYDEFKKDFFPGESVTVTVDDASLGKMPGTVREKSRFPNVINSDGSAQRGFSRYFVGLTNKPNHEALVDDEHIFRDRKVFTKQILRSFLKNSLHRELWSGAPWQVKDRLAQKYRINTQVPAHLQQDFLAFQRRMNLNSKKGEYDGTILNFFPPQKGLPELKPKGQKGKTSPSPQEAERTRREQYQEYQRALAKNSNVQPFGRDTPSASDPKLIKFINQTPGLPTIAAKGANKPPPPPPIKYPREDLENPVTGKQRPAMKFLSHDRSGVNGSLEGGGSGIRMESVAPLLETWNTLNVYCQVFLLDSFNFDDYVDALQFGSEEIRCELVAEIHCAVLSKLVNSEKDMNGQVQISLPSEQESGDDESSEQGTSAGTPTPGPEVQTRTTRSSMAKAEAAESKAQAVLDARIHQGAEIDQCVRGYGWKMRLRKRDFVNGRWVLIIIGLLNLLSSRPRLKDACNEILAQLAPLNIKPTEEAAILQYARLDINLRVKILQILCELSIETQAIRAFMEDCTASMTVFRKEKIEWQRKRKGHVEELKALDEERRALQPEASSPTIEIEQIEAGMEDEEMKDAEDEESRTQQDEDTVMESEEEDPIPQRSLRRANDRAAERKRRLEEDRKRKEKAEVDKSKKPTKEARQLEKVLRKIENVKDKIRECEAEVSTNDEDLRQSDCPRTRVLGKDRFWNRYYWFERNAMPFGGLSASSTADCGYANGCLWVQGPDIIEKEGFIDLTEAENNRYRAAFGYSVPERKLKEEGATHTFDAREWGYYDDPEDLDKLIAWLSEKGSREVKLRKELQTQRDQITLRMQNRKTYLENTRDKRSESAEPVTRVSTRTKTYVDTSGHRFMTWRNTTALQDLGHLHSEPAKGQRRGVAKPVASKKAAVVEDEGRQTRASNRQAKPSGRQGTRYNV